MGEWFTRCSTACCSEQPAANIKKRPAAMARSTRSHERADGVRGAVVRVTRERRANRVGRRARMQRIPRGCSAFCCCRRRRVIFDNDVHAERLAIMRVFGIATLVNIVSVAALSSTIATPLRRLSAAAIRVRRGARTREETPISLPARMR